jgi:uncharacterized OsmC-like protein
MLARLSSFSRGFTGQIKRVVVHSIGGEEWFGVSSDGHGMLFTTGPGAASTPPDVLLMSLGVSSADTIKYILETHNKTVNGLKVDVEGEWAGDLPRRFKEIRLKYTVDSPDVSKNDVARVAGTVVEEICPIAQTLFTRPRLSASVTYSKK